MIIAENEAGLTVSVAYYWYKVTLEVVLDFFVREHVNPFVAGATQSDGTAFDTITRKIFFASLMLMPYARHEIMGSDLTHLTVVYFTRWHSLSLPVC
jgi:hypothetical protein